MSIQTQIQETQSLSFEKRQERETQTDNLHKGIIEKERETHEWFKLSIQKQHALLEKELSLEREISSKRSLYMGEKFKVEAEQLHELENIRVAGQNEIQQYKETRLKKREKDYQLQLFINKMSFYKVMNSQAEINEAYQVFYN